MSIILDAITNFFDRDLCASDDCIVTGGDSSGAEASANAPLVDIAIGELLTISESLSSPTRLQARLY